MQLVCWRQCSGCPIRSRLPVLRLGSQQWLAGTQWLASPCHASSCSHSHLHSYRQCCRCPPHSAVGSLPQRRLDPQYRHQLHRGRLLVELLSCTAGQVYLLHTAVRVRGVACCLSLCRGPFVGAGIRSACTPCLLSLAFSWGGVWHWVSASSWASLQTGWNLQRICAKAAHLRNCLPGDGGTCTPRMRPRCC